MKEKIMDGLQKFSKAMFIPVLILPIAGILIAVGNLFTNTRLQAVLPFLNNPITIGLARCCPVPSRPFSPTSA